MNQAQALSNIFMTASGAKSTSGIAKDGLPIKIAKDLPCGGNLIPDLINGNKLNSDFFSDKTSINKVCNNITSTYTKTIDEENISESTSLSTKLPINIALKESLIDNVSLIKQMFGIEQQLRKTLENSELIIQKKNTENSQLNFENNELREKIEILESILLRQKDGDLNYEEVR